MDVDLLRWAYTRLKRDAAEEVALLQWPMLTSSAR